MKKKMLVIVLFIISITGILAVANASEILESFPVIPPYRPNSPRVEIAEGVGFDKTTNETKQVVFIVMNYGKEKNIYLIIGSEAFRMSESGSILNPEVGTKIFFYKSEDGSVLTVLAQEFDYGEVSISGDFKNYLITFKHTYNYYYNYPKQENPGLGKVQMEFRNKARIESRPVKGSWKDVEIENMSIEEILSSAKPINSWIS